MRWRSMTDPSPAARMAGGAGAEASALRARAAGARRGREPRIVSREVRGADRARALPRQGRGPGVVPAFVAVARPVEITGVRTGTNRGALGGVPPVRLAVEAG